MIDIVFVVIILFLNFGTSYRAFLTLIPHFRLKRSNQDNENLLSAINYSGKLHMVPASLNNKFVIRFCVCAQHATDDDIGLLILILFIILLLPTPKD